MNSNLDKRKYFIIYQITNLIDDKIYVGAHATYNVNDKYMGSSKYLKKDIKEQGRHNFRKEILHIFDNKEDMMSKEAEMVNREFCHRPDTYNRMVGGISEMNWNGMIVVKDKKNNIYSIYSDDPRYLSGELFGIARGNQYSKGKVSVKDKDGNTFQVDKTDKRWLSGELVHTSTGKPGNCSWQDRKHSEESKQKQSKAANKRTGDKNSMFGKKRSKEFKSGIKEKLAFDFYIYDKEGRFVSKQKGINEYAIKNNLSPSSIVKVLKGNYKHTNQLRFFYEYQGELISSL